MKRSFLIFILSLLILSACVPEAEQIPTPTIIEQGSIDVKEATETSVPEPTDTPQPEQQFDLIETATATMTATPNPFADARIISYGYLNNNTLLVTIEVPGGIPEREFKVLVGEDGYTCELLPDFPDRLYCNGPALPGGEKVAVNVFSGDVRVFEGSFVLTEQQIESEDSGPDGDGGISNEEGPPGREAGPPIIND